jgi:DNA-binding response OmpR family regulator
MEATILVIEDSSDLRRLFEHMLREDGYNVVLARGWQEACVMIEAGEPPDLIIFDWMLGDTAGYRWIDDIHTASQTRQIPLLFICSEPPPRPVAELLGNAGIPLLEKPFDIFVFRRRVAALLPPRERMAGARLS